MIRPSGLYALVDGAELPVEIKAPDYVKVPGPDGLVRHELDALDDLLSVTTRAVWRGGEIVLSAVSGEECGFFTNDQVLAEREGLAGDFHDGWHGAAPLAELSEVSEKVSSIHPRRRTS